LRELALERVRLAREDPLEPTGHVVRERRGDEGTVEEHLERPRVDLETGRELLIQGRIFGDASRRHACEVVSEDVLDDLEEACKGSTEE
jgi:hypothetical protein